jgi:hypothetical protein
MKEQQQQQHTTTMSLRLMKLTMWLPLVAAGCSSCHGSIIIITIRGTPRCDDARLLLMLMSLATNRPCWMRCPDLGCYATISDNGNDNTHTHMIDNATTHDNNPIQLMGLLHNNNNYPNNNSPVPIAISIAIPMSIPIPIRTPVGRVTRTDATTGITTTTMTSSRVCLAVSLTLWPPRGSSDRGLWQ